MSKLKYPWYECFDLKNAFQYGIAVFLGSVVVMCVVAIVGVVVYTLGVAWAVAIASFLAVPWVVGLLIELWRVCGDDVKDYVNKALKRDQP